MNLSRDSEGLQALIDPLKDLRKCYAVVKLERSVNVPPRWVIIDVSR